MNRILDLRILAYSLADKKTLLSMVSLMNGEYLQPDFRALWELVYRCFGKYKDIPTERMLEYVAGDAWDQVSAIYAEVLGFVAQVDPREFQVDFEQIKTRFNHQLLLKAGQNVFQKNLSEGKFSDLGDANKVFRDTTAQIERLYKVSAYKEGTLAGTVTEAKEKYCRVKSDPSSSPGVKIGLAEFDRITNGLGDGDLLLIGGESGTGKSTLSMNAAVNAWLNGNKPPLDPGSKIDFNKGRSIVYFTIEMPYDQLERRLHSCIAGVPLYGIRDGTLDNKEEARYFAALEFIEKYNNQFHIVDIPRGATMRYVEAKFMELCESNQDDRPQLVVIDYLNLMSLDDEQGEAGQDWLKVGKIAEQAHEFIRVNHVPVISPAQLNRPPKEESSRQARPDQDRMARSLMLAQNASIIINIEKRKDEHLLKDMRCHIVKNRDGEQGIIVLQKRLDLMRLYDCPSDWDVGDYTSV